MEMSDKECKEFLGDMKILLTSLMVNRGRENIGYQANNHGEIIVDDLMQQITALDYVLDIHFKKHGYERIATDDNLKDMRECLIQNETADYMGGYRDLRQL